MGKIKQSCKRGDEKENSTKYQDVNTEQLRGEKVIYRYKKQT
jgi:hypothetical protein